MLFTKLIASKLTEYLGNVVVIDQCLIGINVWSASIVLHNVKLNLEGQKIFGIAEVEHGTIGSVSISFPWKSLFRARCEVRVDDVSIVLKQAANSTGNPQRRDGFLDNIRTEKSSAQSGFLCRIGQSIVQNLVFSAQNLRISYVDSAVNGGNSVHLSIYVPRISCEPASNDSLTEAGSISRAVHSDSIRIEVKTDETSLGRRSVLDGNCFLEVKEVIFDVSGTLDSPYRADCSLSCRNARMSISASVVQAVTQLCVSVLNLSESQRPPNRPHARPLANGSSWWKYAAIRIINRNRKRQQPFNWARYKLWKDGIQAYYLTCLIDLSAPWLTLDDTSEAGHTSTCLSSSDKLSCETFAQVAIREFEKNGRPPHWRGMWEPIGMREETTLALSAQIAVKCNHLTVSIGGVDIVVDNATSEAVLQQGKVVSQIGMLRQLTISVPSLQQSRALLFGAAGDRSVEWLFCEEKQHVSIPMSLIDVNGSSTPMLISELIAFSEEVISVIRQYDVIVTDEIPAKNGAQGCEETELFSAACRVDIDEIIVTLANASIVAAGVCFIVSNQPTASVSEIAVNSMEGHPLFIGHTMHVIAPISNCVRVELLNANLEPNYLATVESIKLELVSLANNIRSQLSGQRAIISEDTTSRKRVGSAVSVIVRIPTLSCHELEANDVSIEISIRNGWKIVVGAQGIGSDRYFSEDASIALSLWADDYVFETSYKDCIDADGIVFSVVASDLELVLDENLSGTIESIYDLIALLVFKEEDSHVYLKNDELRTPHICGNVDISRSCVHLIGAAHTVYPLECIAKGDNCVQVQVERFSDKRMSISVSLDDGLCIQLEETGAAPINILPSYSTACQNSENAIQVQIHLEPPSSVDFPHFSYTRMRLIVDMKRRAFAAHVPTIMTIWWQFSNPIQPLWRVRTVASRIHFSNLSSRGKSIPLRSPTSRQMADFGFAAQQYYVPPGKQPRSMIGDGGCRYSSPTFPMDLLIDLRATNSKLFYPLRDGSMAPLFLGFRVSQCHLQLLNRDCLSHLEVHGKLSPPRVRWTTLPDHDHYEEVNRHSATNSAAEMCLKLLYTHDTRPPHDAGVAKEAMNISIVGSYGGVSTPPVAVHLTDSDAAAWITLFTFSNSASPQVGSSLLRPQPQCTAASPPRQYTIDVRISPLVVVVPSIGLATALWDGLHLTFTQTGGQIRAPSGVSLIWHPSLHQHEPVDLSLQRLRQLHVSGWAPVAVGPWPAHGGATSTNRTCESPVALDVRFTQDGVGSGGKEIGVHVGSLQLHQSISSLWECQQAGVKEHIFGILALVHHQKAFLTSLEEQRARRFDQLPVPTYRRCKVPLADAESMLHESPPSAESIPTMSEVCHHVEIRHVGLRLDWYHPADQSQSFSLTLDALRCRRFSVQGQHPDPVVDFGVNAITGALGHRVGDEGQESVYVFLDSFDLKTSREKTHTGGVSGPPKVTATPVRVVMVPSYLAAFMGLGDHVQALLRGATTTNSHPRRPLRWRSWWGSFLSEEELWSGSRPRPTTRSPSPLPVVAEEVTEQCPAIDASWVVYSRELLQDVESIEGEEWVSCGRADSTDSLSSPTLLTCRGSSASSSVSSGTCSAHLESSANDLAETVSAASTLVPSLVYSLEVPELVLDYYNLDDVQEAEVLQRGSQLHEDGVRWIQIHSVLPATDAQVPSNLRGTLLEVRVEGARWHSLDDVSWQAGMKACTLLVRPRTHTTAAVVCCVSGVSLIRPAPSDNDGVPLWESPACEVASVEVNLRGPLLTALAEVMQMPSWHPLAEAGPLQPSQLAPRPGLRVLRISCRQWSPEDSLHLSREAGGTVLHFSSTETNHLVVSLSGGVWSIDPAILRRPPGKERVLIVVEDGLTVTVVGGCVRLPLQVLGLQSHLGDAAGVETLLLPFMAVGEGSYLRFDHTRLAFSEEDGNAGEEAMGDAGLHRNPSAQMDKKVAPPSLKPPLPQQRRQWKSPFEADVIATEDDVEVEEEVQHDARLPTPNGSPKNPLAATWSAPRQHSMRSLDDLPVSAQSVDFGDCHRLTPAQNSSERHRVTPTVGEREEDVESEPLRPGVLGTLPSTSQNPASVTKGVPIHLSKFTIQLHSLHIPSRHLEVCGAIRYTSSYPSNGQHTGDVTITDLSVLTRVGASAAAVTTILQPTTVQLTSTNWRHHAVAASDLKVDLSLMDIDLLHHLLRVELREVGKNLHYSNKTAAERQFLELINSTVSWKSAGDLTDPGVDESVVAGVPPSDVDNRSLATTSAIMEPLASLAAFASHISITVGDHRYPLLRLECGAFMYRRAVQTSAMHLQFIQAQDTRCDVYGRGRWDSVLLPVPSLTACVTHTVGRHSSNRHFTLKCQGLQLVASRLLISKGRFVVNQLKQATGRWIAAEAVGVASVSDSARLADVCDDVPEDPGSLLLASQKTSSSAPTPATSASTSTQGGHYTYALLAAESEGSATHRFVNSFNCAFFLMVGSEDGLQGDVHKLLPSSSVDLFIPYKHAATLYVYLYPVDCVDVSGHHHPTVRINRRGQLRDMTHARTALTELRYGAVTGIVVDDLLLVLSCRDAETEASAVAAADAHEDEPQPKLGYSTSPWMSSAASTTASGLPASSPVPVTATVAAGCAPMGKDRGSGVEEGDAGRVVVRVHAKLALRNESGTVLYVRQQAMDDMEGSPSSEKFAVVSRGWHYPLRAACEAVTIRLVHGGKVFEAVLSARGLRGGYYIALYPLSRTAAASRSTHTGGEEIERLCAAEDQRPVELYVVSTVLPGNASSTITLYPRLTVLNHIGVPIKVSIWQSDRRAGPPTAFDVEQQQMWMPNRRDNRRFLSDLIAVGVQEELQHRQAVPVHQCSYDSNLVLGLSLMQSTGEVIRTVALQEVVSSLTKAQHQQHPRHLLLQDAAGRTFHVLVTILPRTVVLSVGMWINNLTEYPLLLSDSLLTRRLSAGQAANTGIIPSRGIPFLIGTPSLQELDQAYFTIGLDGGWSDAVSMDVGSSGVFVSLQIKLGIPRSCNYAIELPNAMDGRPVVVNITPRWTIYNSTTKRMWLHVDFPGLSAARRLAAKAAAAEGPSALGRRNSSTIVSADEGARSSSVPTKGADAIAGVSSIATVALNPGEYHVSCVGTLQGNRLALQENLEGTVPSRSAITGSGMRHVDIATCYTSQQTDYISIDHPGQATFNLWAAPRSADTQVGVSYGASVVAHRSTAAYGPGAMEAADEACTVDAVVTGRVLVSVAPVEQVMAVVLHSIRATKICIQNRCRHTVVFVRQEGSRRRNVVPPTHNRFFLWEDSRGEHRIRVHLEGLKGMWFEVDLASGECQVTRRTTPGLAHYDSDIEAADFHVHGFTSADKSRVTVLVSHGEVPSYATSTAWRTSALLAVDLAFVQLSWLLGDSSTDLAAAGGQKARKGHHASASSPTSSGAHQLPRCLASLVMEGLHLEVLNTEDTRNLSATLHQLQVVDETGPSGPRVVVHRARLREEATDDAPMSGSDDANETDDTSTLASIPRHHHADTRPASRTSSTRSAIRHRLGKVFGGHRASTTTSTTSGADASATLFGAADRLLHLLLPDELNLSLRQDVELSYSLVKYADGLMRVTEANAALAPLVVVINDRWLAMALGEGRTLHNRGSRSTAGATTAVDLHRSTGGHPVSAAPATASMTFPTQPEFLAQMVRALRTEVCAAVGGSVRAPAAAGSAAGHGLGGAATSGGSTEVAHATPSAGGDSSDGASFLLIETLTLSRVTFFVTFQRDKSDPLRPLLGIYALMLPRDLHQTKLRWSSYTLSQQMGTMRSLRAGFQRWAIQGLREQWTKITRIDSVRQAFQLRRRPVPLRRAPVPLTMALVQLRRDAMGGTGELPFLSSASDEDDDGEELDGRV